LPPSHPRRLDRTLQIRGFNFLRKRSLENAKEPG
jgi:hypothetical protein